MKPAFFFLMMFLAGAKGSFLDRIVRGTNSHAAVSRGIGDFGRGDYKAAVSSFAEALRLRPGATAAFDLGTARIAAGEVDEGASDLQGALVDRSLREKAFYNRGNGALGAMKFEDAIRDYVEALRLEPGDMAAKRNLEIAMRQKKKRDQEQQQAGRGQKPQPQEKPAPPKGRPDEQRPQDATKDQGRLDAEALLRSVEQQEREELSRMRKAKRQPGSVGW